jgi:outer membrane protein insertion porin family
MNIRSSIIGFSFMLMLCLGASAWSQSFTVDDIEIRGLQRIKEGTVLNYLPVREGELFDTNNTGRVIRTLYDTGFFEHVALERRRNTLIVVVVERATIGSISVKGNRDISKDQINDVMKQQGLVTGQVFQRSALEQFQQELENQYNYFGKYNATVTTNVRPLSQNRVAVDIVVSEGRAAKIRSIRIIGNEVFKERELIRQLSFKKEGLFTFFTGDDLYSKEKMDGSLEALKSFYLNRGYLKFRVESHQVSLSPNKRDVYIDIRIHEGPLYTFSGFELSGDTVLPEEDMRKYIPVVAEQPYSQARIDQTKEIITILLGREGYGFPEIDVNEKVNEASRQVFVDFHIKPGKHVYVRRINFSGNTKTSNYVLRQSLRQHEGGLLLLNNVKESERQLHNQRYIKDVSVDTERVPGTNNQVDVNVEVQEAPSAEAFVSGGVGSVGLEFNAAINEYNFLGTGRTVGVNYNLSKFGQSVTGNYYDPFHTDSGIGKGYTVFFSRITPGKLDLANYAQNRWGGTIDYNFAITNYSNLRAGYGVERLMLKSVNQASALQIQNFVAANGADFNQISLVGGWQYNTYDRFPFPTRGLRQDLEVSARLPASQRALVYHKSTYEARWFLPLGRKGWILNLSGILGYGNTFNSNGLPFYENFFAGGIAPNAMVRGYDSFSLGPRDTVLTAFGPIPANPLGGNILIRGGASIILPPPLSQSMFRTSGFIDVGNVYSRSLPIRQRPGLNSGPLRMSAGVAFEWFSPLGPLAFSLGFPINNQPGDRLNQFQISFSTSF